MLSKLFRVGSPCCAAVMHIRRCTFILLRKVEPQRCMFILNIFFYDTAYHTSVLCALQNTNTQHVCLHMLQ